MNDVRTHRGFLVTRNAKAPGYLSNPVFDAMFEHYRTHSSPHEDFGFVADAVTHAKGLLFAKGSNLLKDQLWNPSSQWVLSFVASTLDFVNGYPRVISVNNYADLLEFHPKLNTQFDASGNRDKLRQWDSILSLPAEEFISLWLSQESGLFDLVSSLYLIAGTLPEQWSDHPTPM
jgi:hypothetical protein